jgi:hypothetical protein
VRIFRPKFSHARQTERTDDARDARAVARRTLLVEPFEEGGNALAALGPVVPIVAELVVEVWPVDAICANDQPPPRPIMTTYERPARYADRSRSQLHDRICGAS